MVGAEYPAMKEHESPSLISRRDFMAGATTTVLGIAGAQTDSRAQAEPIIDIHQHLGYSGRPDDVLLRHQHEMGITTTILLPAGRNVNSPSTHDGVSNGLQAQCLGSEASLRFSKAHSKAFRFGANEVPDVEGARREIERYLKLGGVVIAEQKFGVECDSREMQAIYALAAEHRVPVLMHWQFQMYNYGFERFHKMLEKYPKVNFLGHAQTWWGHIDRNNKDQSVMYPKGPVTRGGLTDRYLSDYPNMFGDLSAGSGLNALTRDEDFTRGFIERHQDKLLVGSDCTDQEGSGEKCIGAKGIAAIRRLAPNTAVASKIFQQNIRRIMRVG